MNFEQRMPSAISHRPSSVDRHREPQTFRISERSLSTLQAIRA